MLTIPRTIRFSVAVAAALWLSAATAGAQNVCVPNATGVPFLGGPPNWFNNALPEPQFWPEVDDPRWRGAFLRTFGGAAASEHVAFRALRTATHLYFQWNITVDPQLDEVDELWVAFSPGPGQDDVLIQVTPFVNSGTNVIPPTTATAVQVLTRTPGAAFAPAGALPAWLVPGTTDLRVMRVVESGIQGRWAVLMRVPIQAPPNGVNVANSFKMWSGTMVTHPAGIAEYDYPEGIDLTNVLASINNTGWQDVRRDVAPSDASCIRGVSITSSDIGTESNGTQCTNAAGSLSSDLSLTLPGVGPGTTILGLTTLCARPFNETGALINANDLEATFRVANWGTQPTDPQAISAAWSRVNPTPARNTVAIGIGAKGALEFPWQMTANDGTVNDVCTFTPQPTVTGIACNALPATPRQRHQCMLVELGGAPGITFPVSSVARNMNFVSASTFEREAEVSLRGVPAGPGAPPQRDVYLFVQTNNMPAQVNGMTRPPERRRFHVNLPRNDTQVGEGSGEVEPLPKTPFEQLRETEPTYQVHGFRDTGRTVTRKGQTYKLLAPQSSFGYFVDHSGALLGWHHELQGAVEIADDYYRVAVDQGGTAKVTTLIEAIDSRWSVSAHGGLNVPVGDFGDACDPGFSMGLDLEYRFTGMFAAEAFYGHDRFGCGGNTESLNHISINGKVYFGQVKFKPFVGAGIGRYDVSGGSSDTGTNLFGGLQVNVTSKVAVEGTAKFHFLELSGSETNFFTIHGGVRIRF